MPVVFNPFTGNLDLIDNTAAAGSDTQVQFNDGGVLGGDGGLVFNKTTNALTGGAFIPTSSTVPTNGVYLPGANQLALSTNGTGRLFIDASGNVGLGTSAPDANSILDARGLIYAGNGTIVNQIGFSVGNSTAVLGARSNHGVEFRTNNTERMRITSAGLVGIGTSSVNTTLEVVNSSTPIIRVGDGTRHVQLWGGSSTQNQAVGTATAAAFGFNINSSEVARFDTSGRLLVGTSSTFDAGCQFQIVGNITQAAQFFRIGGSDNTTVYIGSARGTTGTPLVLASNDTIGTLAFRSYDGSAYANGATIKAEIDGITPSNDLPTRLVFSTTADGASSPTERMRINNAGGVYIGNSSDYSTVSYSQTTGNGNYYYSPDNGSSGGTIIASNNADRGWSIAYLNKFAWNSGDDARWITFYLNGSAQDSITWTGSAINYGTSSDYRRKANATTYTGGLEKVKQLHVREYDWIEFPDADRSVGFFAHELQEIFPQAVTGIKDGMKIDEFSGEEVPDYQGVDYGKITPLLTSALQEAIAKIETLEAKVAALESV